MEGMGSCNCKMSSSRIPLYQIKLDNDFERCEVETSGEPPAPALCEGEIGGEAPATALCEGKAGGEASAPAQGEIGGEAPATALCEGKAGGEASAPAQGAQNSLHGSFDMQEWEREM